MKKILLVVLLTTISFLIGKEHYLKVSYQSKSHTKNLNKIAVIDKIKNQDIYIYANDKQIENLKKENINFEILENPSSNFNEKMANSTRDLRDWDSYPTYETYVNMMNEFATNYPDICSIETIGNTIEGREIIVAKISDNVTEDEAEPEFYYTGQIHGDEIVSGVLLLRLIDEILTQYGSDTYITNLVNNGEIYINPISNVDGAYAGGNHTMLNSTRGNSNDIDLNRNYPDPFFNDEHPDGESTQQENIVQMDFMAEHNFVMSSNIHSGTVVVNYPYDTISDLHADDDWMVLVSQQYADLAHDASNNTYMTEYENGITNGFAWYSVHGGRQDYFNYVELCREITLELSEAKILPAEDLPEHWDWNRNSLLAFIEQSQYGITGTIVDETNNPLEAKIEILNHDAYNSHVRSDQLGVFYRPIIAGTYDVLISKEGYSPRIFEDVQIENGETTTINATLEVAGNVSVAGVVKDYENNPIVNAEIRLSDDISATSNSSGEYMFSNIATGVYTLIVEADGFPTYSSTLILDNPIFNAEIVLDHNIFTDDFENGLSNWTPNNDWAIEEISGNNVLSDSPSSNYDDNLNSTIILNETFDFSSVTRASCGFKISYDLEESYDYGYFEVKIGNEDWETIQSFNGEAGMTNFNFNLQNALTSNVKFRFRLESDQNTNGDGMQIDDFYIATGQELVAIDEVFESSEVAISQNFPNPFNLGNLTHIKIPNSRSNSQKKLSIFNIKGQKILERSIDNSRSEIYWDGKIDNSFVAPGIYFYRLEIDGKRSSTKKMVILK